MRIVPNEKVRPDRGKASRTCNACLHSTSIQQIEENRPLGSKVSESQFTRVGILGCSVTE